MTDRTLIERMAKAMFVARGKHLWPARDYADDQQTAQSVRDYFRQRAKKAMRYKMNVSSFILALAFDDGYTSWRQITEDEARAALRVVVNEKRRRRRAERIGRRAR